MGKFWIADRPEAGVTTPDSGYYDLFIDTSVAKFKNSAGTVTSLLSVAAAATAYQPLDADLTALAGLSTAANKIPYFTGLHTAGMLDLDIDGTMAANSDTSVPSQKAVRTFVGTAVTGLLDFKGSTDCSGNPNYPAASKGDAYVVSVAGKIGGASGVAVDVSDVYFAIADNAGGTQAAVGSSWDVLEHNLAGALLAANNLSDVASATTSATNLGLGTGNTVTFTGLNLSAAAKINLNATALPTPQTGTVLQAAHADGVPTRIELIGYGSPTFFSSIAYNGTAAAKTALTSGTQIGGFNGWGYNGTAVVGPVATFRLYANQTWSVGVQGSYAEVATTPNGGSTLTTSMRWENSGGVTLPPTVTGGDKGVGTLNATNLYIANNQVAYQTSSPTFTTITATTQLVTAAGSAGTPGILLGAGTVGIYQASSGTMNFSTGGALRASITGGKFIISTDGVLYPNFSGNSQPLQAHGVNGATSGMIQGCWQNTQLGTAVISIAKSRSGTVGTHTIVTTGDTLGVVSGEGSDGVAFFQAGTVTFKCEGTIGTGQVPGLTTFSTATAAGTLTEAMCINSSQQFGIGAVGGAATTGPDARLTVVAPDATTSQIRLRSSRSAIVSGNLIGGVEFMSNDTNLTAPGLVSAKVQAIAGATHTASDLNTRVAIFACGSGDTNVLEVARFVSVPLLVNAFQFSGSATTNPLLITAIGTDTDVGISLVTKGAGPLNLSISTGKIGAYGVTAVVRPSAFTQTYSTATHTIANRAASAITDNSGGVSGYPTIAVVTNPTFAWNGVVLPTAAEGTAINTAFTAIKAAIAALAVAVNNVRTDDVNTVGGLNAAIDDLQSIGWLQ